MAERSSGSRRSRARPAPGAEDTLARALLDRWHELSNALAGVTAFAQLATTDETLPERLHHDAELLLEEAERLRSTLDELVGMARLEVEGPDPAADSRSRRSPRARPAVAPSTASGRAGVVLVVDDEAGIRELLARALARAGHEVTTAGSAAEASALLERLTYDVLVVDRNLPDGDGLELAGAARRQRPELEGRVILMTGQLGPADAPSREMEGVPVLRKPFDLQEVLALVDKTLG